MQPSSVYKVPTNHYQHFVTAYVLTNQTMKQADVMKCAEVEMEGSGYGMRKPVCYRIKESSEHLRWSRQINVKVQFINCWLCIWQINSQVDMVKTILVNNNTLQINSETLKVAT